MSKMVATNVSDWAMTNAKLRAVIIGKSGQVAWELMRSIPSNIDAVALGRDDINLFDEESISKTLSQIKPDIIINASAYTAVDKAEEDKEAAFALNGNAVGFLAKCAKQLDARFVHISTDFVFDGTNNTAYLTSDSPNPINVYGASKLAGEKAIESIYPENSVIVRTSWVYSSHGNNFVKTMLKLMQERDQLKVVSDQVGCPTSANGLAKFLWRLAQCDNFNNKVILHYSDLGISSWYDFAFEIYSQSTVKGLLKSPCLIEPITSSEFPTAASRPLFSVLKSEIEAYQRSHWKLMLSIVLDELRSLDFD